MAVKTDKYVMKQVNGDTYTPISIFESIVGTKKVLFESNAKFKQNGRYSFIAFNPVGERKGNAESGSYAIHNQELTTEQKPV